MNRFALLLVFAMICSAGAAQEILQVVRGKVIDEATHQPLPGATVILKGSDPMIGTITNIHGEFRLDKVPVGRRDIQISYMGYETRISGNLLVSSGKELVIEVALRESVVNMQEVVITADEARGEALNSMSIISARQLGVEEARRYAGGMDDPARLASVFAGVASDMSGNGIVIRGNAPKGLLWSLEGVQIPNPNHFANVTALGGGAFTALSSQLLANSDFHTSAFPAEYGNALSGVFDIRMRNGNTEQYEHTFQAGLLGLDFASEGPLGPRKGGSYLVNYRYSTFGLLAPLLPDNAGNIRYQDLSFKLNLPAGKAGVLTLWGIGSTDVAGADEGRDSSEWRYISDREKDVNKVRFGAAGLALKRSFGKRVWSVSTLAWTADELIWNADRLDAEMVLQPSRRVEAWNSRMLFSTKWNVKWSSRHTNRTGFIVERLGYGFLLKHLEPGEGLVGLLDDEGNSWLHQAFSQSQFSLTPKLVLQAGLHFQHFALTGANALEPRAGLQWKLRDGQQLSLGYGLHSQTEPLPVYLLQTPQGTAERPNMGLGFSRAHHLVAGYGLNISEHLRFKLEPYVQWLYDVPASADGKFSMLNVELDWFVDQPLHDIGKGRNIGLDLTLERFMHKGFYYLLTGTVFESKYADAAGIWRNTRFNKAYVINILAGKEWATGSDKQNLLGASLRLNLQGGNWRTPVDEAASLAAGVIIEDESRMFAEQEPGVVHLDLSLNYRRNHSKWSGVWALQMVNILGAEEFYGYQINLKDGRIEEEQEVIFLPNLSYKIEF